MAESGTVQTQVAHHDVLERHSGLRLDAFLVACYPWRSRRDLVGFVEAGDVHINANQARKKARRLTVGDRVSIALPVPTESADALAAISLEILFEDDDLVVVNKPAGLAVHPAASCQHVNLLKRLELRYRSEHPDPSAQPSIVHRLDRATSGVIAYARRREHVAFYTGQFEARTTTKVYAALVHGRLEQAGRWTSPLLAVDGQPVRVDPAGKASQTDYAPRAFFDGLTLLEVRPMTGRKHQIRVHFSQAGFPLRYDEIYGCDGQPGAWPLGARLGLHAQVLELQHRNGERLRFETATPKTMMCPQPEP